MNKILSLTLTTILTTASSGNPHKDTIYFNNGKSISGNILEADSRTMIFARESDKQRFRLPIDLMTLDSQKLVELYHSTDRYGDVSKVDIPLSVSNTKKYADIVDNLIERRLRQMKLRSNDKADEDLLLRRLYLVSTGRIPSKAERDEYMKQSTRDRWSKQVDKLLDSNGYVNNQLNWLYDLLRVQDQPNRIFVPIGLEYRDWLREQVINDVPWDKFVYKLITSNGNPYDGGDSRAVNYYIRDRGMENDSISLTTRAFLGTRMQCAMCHDHPSDRWTQKQFYEMASFIRGVDGVTTNSSRARGNELRARLAAHQQADTRFRRWKDQMNSLYQFELDAPGQGTLTLPNTFVGFDASPGERVHATPIFTSVLETDPSIGSGREAFARWLTSPNNPRFTTVIANRLWKRVFGVGLYEPVDNFMDGSFPLDNDLMWFLERMMYSSNYSIKEFYRVLFNTELFKREVQREDMDVTKYTFQGPKLRRMTGEQLWDSLVTLVYSDIDEKSRGLPVVNKTSNWGMLYNNLKYMSPTEINDTILSKSRGTRERSLVELMLGRENVWYGGGAGLPNSRLIRSTYLPQPVNGGHLIRVFGGSDKQTIENSNEEPNTPQVLSLMNGFVEQNILNNQSADFVVNSRKGRGKKGEADNLFITILGRKPNMTESRTVTDLMKGTNDGYKNVTWVLLNSHEFKFIQ